MYRPVIPQLELPVNPTRVSGVWWRPNQAFVRELARYLGARRVLEAFAGNGYLSGLLRREGVDILATTLFRSHDSHELGLYGPVEELEAQEAVLRYGAERDVLLFCWPTATTEVLRAARAWGPEKDIVFIGEVTDYSKDHLGGCACDAFFESIEVHHRFASYAGNMLESAFVCRLREWS